MKADIASFVALHSVIHPRAVTEFIYRYNISGNRAHVLMSFKLQSTSRQEEVCEVLNTLKNSDMVGFDISDDEVAKSHVRYMIGGCQSVPNERIFRFGELHFENNVLAVNLLITPIAFPERPGALRKFLVGLHKGWNISLFHYRNHGAGMWTVKIPGEDIFKTVVDLGKVLAGIQVPADESEQFDQFLDTLDYAYVEETENAVYKRFLQG